MASYSDTGVGVRKTRKQGEKDRAWSRGAGAMAKAYGRALKEGRYAPRYSATKDDLRGYVKYFGSQSRQAKIRADAAAPRKKSRKGKRSKSRSGGRR
jgi:hypothetical protein